MKHCDHATALGACLPVGRCGDETRRSRGDLAAFAGGATAPARVESGEPWRPGESSAGKAGSPTVAFSTWWRRWPERLSGLGLSYLSKVLPAAGVGVNNSKAVTIMRYASASIGAQKCSLHNFKATGRQALRETFFFCFFFQGEAAKGRPGTSPWPCFASGNNT